MNSKPNYRAIAPKPASSTVSTQPGPNPEPSNTLTITGPSLDPTTPSTPTWLPLRDDPHVPASTSRGPSSGLNDPSRPHLCEECSVRFTRKEHLKRHLLSRHASSFLKCEVCSLLLYREAALHAHTRTAHPTVLQAYEQHRLEIHQAQQAGLALFDTLAEMTGDDSIPADDPMQTSEHELRGASAVSDEGQDESSEVGLDADACQAGASDNAAAAAAAARTERRRAALAQLDLIGPDTRSDERRQRDEADLQTAIALFKAKADANRAPQ